TAGGAYVPAMADESVMVAHQGTIFLAGPPLVKAATGEVVTAEALGGAEVHCKVSGVADHYAENDEQAMKMVRNMVAHLNIRRCPSIVRQKVEPPALDPKELYGIVP